MNKLKELYKKYTRTREQRAWFAVISVFAVFGLFITIIAPMFVLAMFIIFVLPMAVIVGIVILISKWVEKGERY